MAVEVQQLEKMTEMNTEKTEMDAEEVVVVVVAAEAEAEVKAEALEVDVRWYAGTYSAALLRARDGELVKAQEATSENSRSETLCWHTTRVMGSGTQVRSVVLVISARMRAQT